MISPLNTVKTAVYSLALAVATAAPLMLLGCEKKTFDYSSESLAQARSGFQTEIVDTSFEADGEPATPPSHTFNLIRYASPAGEMAAYITPNPEDGEKRPAIIWLIGGYGGIGNDDYFWRRQRRINDQSASAFRNVGIVMMIPSFRGENNNPGQYEMFYGELDDLAAAKSYLENLPYVDPDRIYLAGHSTGGTRTLLANEYIPGFRAAFAIGAIPDLQLRIQQPMSVTIPFNTSNPEEFRLRSPATFIRSLQSPTYYFEGAKNWWDEFDEVQAYAHKHNVPFYAYKIRAGDHFNIIAPINELIAEKILADTGPLPHFEFTDAELLRVEQSLR